MVRGIQYNNYYNCYPYALAAIHALDVNWYLKLNSS
jgi:hypothetical protein